MTALGALQCVVLDCPAPRELAGFYRGLLGGEVDRPDRRWSLDAEWSTLHLPGGVVLAFQYVRDHRPPVWGDPARPQQSHLDVDVTDLAAAREYVLAHGGRVLPGPPDRGWTVCSDPAGHTFCLLHPRVS
ncbi:catechol 2,3-dioxygenase-like lactoylglutathione lyase family enzyme [Crossiella equi]|uniref:Catechol 2,3-dioxygenase-like lactoylglutathione lyase family enzyme n=1 Tax=Crossiella equi TaxID=130796 RepID=A0ABS5A475_9PSEU|nr:VOC family protein [Crossiella equi]MBP2471374.1 catechol 2,3-dioxygenase-like lactoylglutathione lyase family enzyme [Crossiella equi]